MNSMKQQYSQWALGILCSAIFGFSMVISAIPQTPSQAQDVPTPTPTPLSIDPVFLQQLLATEQQVCNLRGIINCTPANRELRNDTEIRLFLAENWEQSYPQDQARADQYFYTAFGFIPPTNDDLYLWTLFYQASVDQAPVSTYYDRQRGTVVVRNTFGLAPYDELIYAYAYIQSLLDAVFPPIEADSLDARMAQSAIRNGDAQLMVELYTEQMLQNNPAALDSLLRQIIYPVAVPALPSIFEAEQEFKYVIGRDFVEKALDNEGWNAVDSLHSQPPLSTEQILPHVSPINWLPMEVTLRPIDNLLDPVAGWMFIQEDTLGEFYLREHLKLYLPLNQVEAMASGWGGDRFLIYGRSSDLSTILVWKSAWDSSEDALQFRDLYTFFLNQWLGTMPTEQFINGEQIRCWETATRTACLQMIEDESLIIITPSLELTLAIMHQQNVISIFG